MNRNAPLISSETELDDFLARFEDGTYPKESWTHRAHLLMAAGYLTQMTVEQATPKIRERIKAYNLAQGGENTDTAGARP